MSENRTVDETASAAEQAEELTFTPKTVPWKVFSG